MLADQLKMLSLDQQKTFDVLVLKGSRFDLDAHRLVVFEPEGAISYWFDAHELASAIAAADSLDAALAK